MKKEIFDNYYNKLFYWALKKTHSKEDAQDLVHDIFYAIYSYLEKNIEIEKLENLIWKIAHNCWCNKVATYTKQKQEIYSDDIINSISGNDDFVDKIIYKEIIEMVHNLNLSDNELNTFVLYYELDLSIKEISNKINQTESNIKYYLYNVRKKIKERYK